MGATSVTDSHKRGKIVGKTTSKERNQRGDGKEVSCRRVEVEGAGEGNQKNRTSATGKSHGLRELVRKKCFQIKKRGLCLSDKNGSVLVTDRGILSIKVWGYEVKCEGCVTKPRCPVLTLGVKTAARTMCRKFWRDHKWEPD